MKMDVVTAAGWRPPVGISYGQPMEAKRSKIPGIAPAPLTILTVGEVSQYLRIHPTTIYRLVRTNRIPGFRVGSDWRFNTDAIDRWMSKQQSSVNVPSHNKHSA